MQRRPQMRLSCVCQYRVQKSIEHGKRDLQFIEEPVTGITVGMQKSGMASRDQAESTESAQGASGRAWQARSGSCEADKSPCIVREAGLRTK